MARAARVFYRPSDYYFLYPTLHKVREYSLKNAVQSRRARLTDDVDC